MWKAISSRATSWPLRDPDDREFARGLTNYSAEDIRRIKGLKTDQIAQVLGHCPYDEIIHRDNMVVTSGRIKDEG